MRSMGVVELGVAYAHLDIRHPYVAAELATTAPYCA